METKEELEKWQGWVVQHVCRSANGVAHHLAHLAFMYGEGREWTADFPILMEEALADVV